MTIFTLVQYSGQQTVARALQVTLERKTREYMALAKLVAEGHGAQRLARIKLGARRRGGPQAALSELVEHLEQFGVVVHSSSWGPAGGNTWEAFIAWGPK